MCLVNETPVKPGKSIVGWKVFRKDKDGLRAEYASEDAPLLKRGVVYTAKADRGNFRRSYRDENYLGFHAFPTRAVARVYAKEAKEQGMNAVIRKCVFLDLIAKGEAWVVPKLPSFRAMKMIVL